MSSHHEVAEIQSESGQKTLAAYVTGFILSMILTVMAFGLVEKQILSTTYLYISLATLAIIQLFVQSICFLRLNSSSEGRWNLMPFIFTILIIAILAGGTLWIMYNLNYYMTH